MPKAFLLHSKRRAELLGIKPNGQVGAESTPETTTTSIVQFNKGSTDATDNNVSPKITSNSTAMFNIHPLQYSAFTQFNAVRESERNALLSPPGLPYINGYLDAHINSLNLCYPFAGSSDVHKLDRSLVSNVHPSLVYPHTSLSNGLFRPYDLVSSTPPLFGHHVATTTSYLKRIEDNREQLRSGLYANPDNDGKRLLISPSNDSDDRSCSCDSESPVPVMKQEITSPQSSPPIRPVSAQNTVTSTSSSSSSPPPQKDNCASDSSPARITSSLTNPLGLYPEFLPSGSWGALGRLPPQPPSFLPSAPNGPSPFIHRSEFSHLSSQSLGGPLYLDASGNTGVIHPTLLTMGSSLGRRNDPNKPPPVKKYKCDVCGKAFSRSNTLVTHKRIHTGDKPFKCELCGRAFRQPGNLTRHRLTHTTVKPYVCPQCNKAFNRASNLHTHMRTHTNYKPFVCQYCGKGFHQKIDMKIHSYTHTGEKPHKCKVCGRGFKQLTHLTYHMRTHSDEKVYSCDVCGKGFNQKGNLQAHIYGHTGERPHKCDICGKGFTLASTLNTHRRTHAEKKPFVCQYCGKDFYQKNALKSHLVASHPYTANTLLL